MYKTLLLIQRRMLLLAFYRMVASAGERCCSGDVALEIVVRKGKSLGSMLFQSSHEHCTASTLSDYFREKT